MLSFPLTSNCPHALHVRKKWTFEKLGKILFQEIFQLLYNENKLLIKIHNMNNVYEYLWNETNIMRFEILSRKPLWDRK